MENKLEKFIKNNIIVARFPVTSEIKDGIYSDFQVIINVSDDFWLGNSEEVMKLGKLNYYFPMGEQSTSMGLSSLFGALQVLYEIYKWNPEWKVLIHCSAGLNRSPTIKSAFHYMMTEQHEDVDSNKLIYNCLRNHLPDLNKTELFLNKCKEAFDNQNNFLGGMYDWVIKESNLN